MGGVTLMNQLINDCRVCGSHQIKSFFHLGNQPYANALLKQAGQIEKKYPLSLNWCEDCNLVQLNYTADPKSLFSQYVWVTATSSTAREYSQVFCENAIKKCVKNKISYILEIASNDGTFLKPFLKKGYQVLGIDPAENIVDIANSNGITTECAFFGEKIAENIINEKGYPGIVFARNVLPHVANLHDFVKGIKKCMKEDTLLILEVHYAKNILEELHYDSIYHEHLCYFTCKTLEKLLNLYELYAFDSIRSPISGGSLVLYIRNTRIPKEKNLVLLEEREEMDDINSYSKWERFAILSQSHRKLLLKLIDEAINYGKHVVGYGASARSATLLNFCNINSARISAIADQNPLKQGLFAPGSQIPILSVDEVMSQNPAVMVILAWNFLSEIRNVLMNKYGFKGEIIIPLPYPPKKYCIEED
jgi:SAM-dependent methyltransferase